MRRRFFWSVPFLLLLSRFIFATDENTRVPFVSGSFYPADPVELNRTIDSFLNKVPPQEKIHGMIKILILPHAGYMYSGQTAAFGYKMIEGEHYDTVVLIGPYHKAYFNGALIWKSGSWKTPLGEVPIDVDMANAIYKENANFQSTRDIHSAEHSLEVQLPFLQKVLSGFKIVPILISDPSPENYKALARSIYQNIRGRDVLVIASSDMSHYYPDSTARQMDSRALENIIRQDPERLSGDITAKTSELCGHAAVATALEIARLLGDTKTKLLNYSTSADSTGDKSQVVGYSANVIYQNGGLDAAQKSKLLQIARNAAENYINGGTVSRPDMSDPLFMEDRAVFVTIRKFGQLRGCIGSLNATEPLGLAIRNMAIQAASKDPRFKPVQKEELKDLQYEISVLSKPEKVANAGAIRLGRDGVIVQKGAHSGVFLPKVAEELAFNKENFLKELCTQKAGLPENCWQDPQADLYVFTADEFGDSVVK